MILDEKPKDILDRFLDAYCSMFPEINKKKALEYIKTQKKFEELTEEWYRAIDNNSPSVFTYSPEAFRVYNDDYYFTDLWTCFIKYSRQYLKNVRKEFVFGKGSTIADLGCGVGLTTVAIKQMYPQARVIGTNLPDTKQWKFAEKLSKKYDFELAESINEPVMTVFASEYFEHIYSPIAHVNDLIMMCKPQYFIIANAFNTRSIGHYRTYIDTIGVPIDQSKISRVFNDNLRNHGYIKMKMPFFNNKPNVWVKP